MSTHCMFLIFLSVPAFPVTACQALTRDGGGDPSQNDGKFDTIGEERLWPPEHHLIVDLQGTPSAVAVGDFDGDENKDIAAYVVKKNPSKLVLAVAWGGGEAPWTQRYEWLLEEDEAAVPTSLRNTSSQLVLSADLDLDGLEDIVTSTGILPGSRLREPEWAPLPGEGKRYLLPVAIVRRQGEPDSRIVRITPEATLEICIPGGDCSSLEPEGFSPLYLCDLATGDFNGGGVPDIIVGGHIDAIDYERSRVTWLITGESGYREARPYGPARATPVFIDIADYEAGDVDGDGIDDLVAQDFGNIPDFPSTTRVFKGGETELISIQCLRNHDNHNDSSELADVDGDGLLDYMQIGVDKDAFGLRRGRDGYLGTHDPEGRSDIGWEEIPASAGYGIQCLKLTGRQWCDIIIRGMPDPDLQTAPLHVFY